jgi:hypothetical protein
MNVNMTSDNDHFGMNCAGGAPGAAIKLAG